MTMMRAAPTMRAAAEPSSTQWDVMKFTMFMVFGLLVEEGDQKVSDPPSPEKKGKSKYDNGRLVGESCSPLPRCLDVVALIDDLALVSEVADGVGLGNDGNKYGEESHKLSVVVNPSDVEGPQDGVAAFGDVPLVELVGLVAPGDDIFDSASVGTHIIWVCDGGPTSGQKLSPSVSGDSAISVVNLAIAAIQTNDGTSHGILVEKNPSPRCVRDSGLGVLHVMVINAN